MKAALVPSGDVTALPAPPPPPPRPPPRPPRPAASASVADGTPGQFERFASHTVRVFFAGSTSTNSALAAPVRYHIRPSASQVADTVPPTTRPVSEGASIF